MYAWIDRSLVSVIMVTQFNSIPMHVVRWVVLHRRTQAVHLKTEVSYKAVRYI